jgi:hypothetical protein
MLRVLETPMDEVWTLMVHQKCGGVLPVSPLLEPPHSPTFGNTNSRFLGKNSLLLGSAREREKTFAEAFIVILISFLLLDDS